MSVVKMRHDAHDRYGEHDFSEAGARGGKYKPG